MPFLTILVKDISSLQTACWGYVSSGIGAVEHVDLAGTVSLGMLAEALLVAADEMQFRSDDLVPILDGHIGGCP